MAGVEQGTATMSLLGERSAPDRQMSKFYLYAAFVSTCMRLTAQSITAYTKYALCFYATCTFLNEVFVYEDRAWSFCVSLSMQALGGMRMVSIEHFAEGIGQMVLSGHLGRAFDRVSREIAIMSVVPVNNISIALAASMFIVCLSVDPNSPWYFVFLVLGILVCAVNRLFLNAEKFLVSRDWVVVISNGETLSSLNATLRALDQLTNVISPLIIGLLVTVSGLRVTCALFGSFSLVSMASKAFFLRALYIRTPQLAQKRQERKEEKENDKKVRKSILDKIAAAFESIPDVLRTYTRQTVIAAAFGMSLLYMTVMGFDGLAVGYGQSAGLPDYVLGAFRSFGSAMGILGALSYAFFERRLGVRKTGLLGLTCQQVFLIAAVVSIWLPGSPFDPSAYFHGQVTARSTAQDNAADHNQLIGTGQSLDSIITFLCGIASARFGLWMADLSIIHIMQEGVPESDRNTVFGVHNALCQTFSVLKDILVIILPDPSTFGICILISYAFLTSGYFSFIYYLVEHPATTSSWHKSSRASDELNETPL